MKFTRFIIYCYHFYGMTYTVLSSFLCSFHSKDVYLFHHFYKYHQTLPDGSILGHDCTVCVHFGLLLLEPETNELGLDKQFK